jgi:hypothetical protein
MKRSYFLLGAGKSRGLRHASPGSGSSTFYRSRGSFSSSRTWPSRMWISLSEALLTFPGSGHAKRSRGSFCPVCATLWSRRMGTGGSRRPQTLSLPPAIRTRPNKARAVRRRPFRFRNVGSCTNSRVAAAYPQCARPLPATRCPAVINLGTMQHRWAVLLTGAIGVGAAVFGGRFAYQPTAGLQFMAVVFGLLVVVLVLSWVTVVATQTLRRRPVAAAGLLMALASFGGCVVARDVGRAMADRRFRADLGAYEQVVTRLRAQPLRPLRPMPSDSLPQLLRGRVSHVMSWRGAEGAFGVDFHYGGGFPVKHSAYVYYEGGARPLGLVAPFHWRHARALAPHWFAASD